MLSMPDAAQETREWTDGARMQLMIIGNRLSCRKRCVFYTSNFEFCGKEICCARAGATYIILLLLRPAEPILFTYRIMARATPSILKLTNKYGHDPLH
jgi:hypothetical protein